MFNNYTPYNEQETNDLKLIQEIYLKMENIYTRDNQTAHFTSSSWIINKERNKVLMIYHNIYDSWAWTGGHADGDDDLIHVAIKEAKEETGLENLKPLINEIFSIEILPVAAHIKRGKHISTHLHLNTTFLLEADENEFIRIKEDENSNIAWFDLEEAIQKSTEPHMKIVYQKLNDKLKTL